jgi:hypothetical protein
VTTSRNRPRVKMQAVPKFPADVVAGDGMAIERSGATYTFSTVDGSVAFFAYKSTNQGPVANATQISFDTIEYNNGSAYSSSTNLFTCPTDGVYEVTAKLRYLAADIADLDDLTVAILVDGVAGPNFKAPACGNTLNQDRMIHIRRLFSAGATIGVRATLTGADKTIVAGTAAAPSSWFSARRLFTVTS